MAATSQPRMGRRTLPPQGRAVAVAFLGLLASGLCAAFEERRVCHGVSNRLSMSGNTKDHYNNLKKVYEGCEVVLGNLEITHMDRTCDLNFLMSIQEVSGYVLIALNTVKRIPLENLQIIRGNILFESAALAVILNDNGVNGLEELPMRRLAEIQKGVVQFVANSHLCNMDNVLWEDIVNDGNFVKFVDAKIPSTTCPKCHPNCKTNHCWGAGLQDCQTLTKVNCSQQCKGRCKGSLPDDCCHSQCAAGCTGPKDSDCLACRRFSDSGNCRKFCPPLQVYNTFTYQLEDNPKGKYSFGATCVKKCPRNYVVSDCGACVRTCGMGFIEVEENGIRKCKRCDGSCGKVCTGVGTGELKVFYDVNACNIDYFENCTTINGDLVILTTSILGDPFTKTPPLDPKKLEIFKTVKEITGFLTIQEWPANVTDLNAFENLEIIRGRTKYEGQYALAIMSLDVRYLGLRSLKKVNEGDVIIYKNPNLCYAHTVDWKQLFLTENQKMRSSRNGNETECVASGQICHPLCSDVGCWGPGPFQCFSCRHFIRSGECVKECNILQGEPREFKRDSECLQCHPECLVLNSAENSATCLGPGPGNCTKCAHFRDGLHCVKSCPIITVGENSNLIWKYADENSVCQSCHPNCSRGCKGPGLEGCHNGYSDGSLWPFIR